MKNNRNESYLDSVHRYGRIWGLIIFGLVLAMPIVVCLLFGALPEWRALFSGLLAILPMYWAVGIVEMFTYVPMLGAGGAYLSFVTGNISNLKLPCALDAMERANVKPSSEEGEIISTISIAVSGIVTTVIIIIGVVMKMTLSFAKPYADGSSMCVGNFALLILLVMAAAMMVGEYLFPISFCTTKTGRTPPCSLPTTGDKSA